MALHARKLRRDEREDLVSSWGAEQALLVERSQEFAAYVETFAPGLSRNVNAYAGRFRVEVERLRGDIDEHEFVQRRGLDLRRCLAAAWIAATLGEAEPIDVKTDVVAVHIAYRRDERVRFLSLDLDGTHTDPAIILAAIRADIGDDSMLVHSGSGRDGRCRLLLRLNKSKTIDDLQMLAKRWIAGLGFPVVQGDVEVFPGTHDGRCAFGLGGCTWFAPDLSTRKNQRPIDLWRRFVELKPIDLRALALRHPALEQEPTKSAAKKGVRDVGTSTSFTQQLPRRYVAERRPPTPKATQELAKQGISSVGERDDARYKLVRDRQIRGWSEQKTIEYLRAWILDGKIDLSREAQKNRGIEGQLRDVERLVKRVYATHPLPGRPEPVDLSASEVARIREHAAIVAMATGFTENAIRSFLIGILPLFKAARCAGLPHVRIHTDEWRKAGGSRVTQLREACVLFAASTGYRSANSLRKRGLSSQAAIEHAYAQSWTTSFQFDEP